MDLEDNNKNLYHLCEQSKRSLCSGICKFIKKSFLGTSRCPEVQTAGEDWVLNEELQKKPHKDKFTNRLEDFIDTENYKLKARFNLELDFKEMLLFLLLLY